MIEKELKYFIEKNNVEWHRHGNEILIMPDFYDLTELKELLSNCIYDDGGINCYLKEGYICFDIEPICDYYGIDTSNIFKGDDWDE